MSWKKSASAPFQLSEAEAQAAVKKFKAGTGYDDALLDKVRRALIDLEEKHLDTRLYRRLEVVSPGYDALVPGSAWGARSGGTKHSAPAATPMSGSPA